MKTIFILVGFLTAYCLVGCRSDQQGGMYVKNLSLSKCGTKAADVPREDDPSIGYEDRYITYKAINATTLQIGLFRFFYACDMKRLDIQVTKSDKNQIYIDQIPVSTVETDCICQRDVVYEITDLKVGESYHVVIRNGGLEFFTFDVDFTANVNVKVPYKRN